MQNRHRVLLVFVDGLGIGPANPAVNPVHAGVCPALSMLMADHAVPIDASLDVPGLPQSATGQTAILTGLNAAKTMGRHIEGFPGPELRAMIRDNNIYSKLARLGRTSTFANAYFVADSSEVLHGRIQSVTTVAALSAFGRIRTRTDLEANRAVYQDLTCEILRARGYDGPLIPPREAAAHLLAVAAEYDFTLFEYFQTDRAGHTGDIERAGTILALFDPFLADLITAAERGDLLLLLTSDHGNIEDMRTIRHTDNPVPFAALGPGAESLPPVRSLTDIVPALLACLR